MEEDAGLDEACLNPEIFGLLSECVFSLSNALAEYGLLLGVLRGLYLGVFDENNVEEVLTVSI